MSTLSEAYHLFAADQTYKWRAIEPATARIITVECLENGVEATAKMAWNDSQATLTGTPYLYGDHREVEGIGWTNEYPLPGKHIFV